MRIATAFVFCAALGGCDSPTAVSVALADSSLKSAATVSVDNEFIGEYLCTVAERAAIERLHLEDAGPPEATSEPRFGTPPPTRFKIGISAGQDRTLRLIELPYDGSDRDQTDWGTQNSVIHGTYSGTNGSFRSALDDPEAYFVLGATTVRPHADGNREFYHSGFAWAGGEDKVLSVRWGHCKSI